MDYIYVLLILLSVILSSTRNILSKGFSKIQFGTKDFFLVQFALFLGGSIAILLVEKISVLSIAPITAFYALIYGILLVLAQWCYTSALSGGNIAICSTLYSLGFIFPTMSGVLFWNEKMTLFDVLGIICVIPAIIISGMKSPRAENTASDSKYIIPLIVAMLSAGGLGIMQKIQQSSYYAEQKCGFVFFGFLFSCIVSFICFLVSKPLVTKAFDKKTIMAAGAGICFAGCNLLNTTLAGALDSAVFFPVYNVSVILLSIVLSFIIFKEKMSKKDFIVFMLGIASILLLNL